ncbi:MAG TPA: DUF3100 domain-containing protein, partial [Paenalcaligenes sp.]|nr:DUF3100 domain-containing protein [Paenalcaligenes sp.]
MPLSLLLNWRLHLLVIIASVISEWIGIINIPLGPGALLLLPLFYAFIIAVLINPYLFKGTKRWVPIEVSMAASPLILVSILPFIARFGTTIGPAIEDIINAGPALLLQELGNLGTMIIALPVAVLLLKMGRETIGATFSIAREPNIAIISDKYGLKGPEGIGVMGVYVVGTMFGTLWFALMASFIMSLDLLDPRALAMACGVGSGSMVAACSGALANMAPEIEETLLAFAGASNLLTYATGLYLSLFVALPIAERFYGALTRRRLAAAVAAGDTTAGTAPDFQDEPSETDDLRPENHLGHACVVVAAVCFVAWLSNAAAGIALMDALPGMIILYVMTIIGLVVTRFMPFYLPSVAWVSLVSIVLTLPWIPGSEWMLEHLAQVNFLAIVTPVLAYAGLALTPREFTMFRRTGWKLIITALLVFTGTFVGSAIIADILL